MLIRAISELLPLLIRETRSSLQTVLSQARVVDETLRDVCSRVRIKPEYGDLTSDSSEESRDPSREVSPEDSLDEVVEGLKEDVECLLDLSPRLKEPVQDMDDFEEPVAVKGDNPWDPEQPFCESIRVKFPSCEEQLVRAMGKATHQTCQRLQAERIKAAELVSSSGLAAEPTQQANKTVFHDSGLAASLPATTLPLPRGIEVPASSYAPTVKSFSADETTRTRNQRQF